MKVPGGGGYLAAEAAAIATGERKSLLCEDAGIFKSSTLLDRFAADVEVEEEEEEEEAEEEEEEEEEEAAPKHTLAFAMARDALGICIA